MADIDEAKRIAFLAELSRLTEKYGIEISGCGCCGSPFLNDDASTIVAGKDVRREMIGDYVSDRNGDNLSFVYKENGNG